MKKDHLRKMLKKSALKTSENFTDRLMGQIEATSEGKFRLPLPSVKVLSIVLGAVMLVLSISLFYTDITFFSEIEMFGKFDRTKLFVLLLLSALVGVNHLLKLQQTSQ